MTREEFDTLWDSELKDELSKLEVLRQKERRAIFGGVAVWIFMTLIASFALILLPMSFEDDRSALLFVPSMGIGYLTYLLKRPAEYRKLYKEQIITSLVRHTKYKWRLDTSLYGQKKFHVAAMRRFLESYKLQNQSFRDLFIDSGLFRSRVTTFYTDDVFVSETMPLCAAEVNAVRGSGKNKTIIFRGLLFRFDISKPFVGETYIRNENQGIFSTPMGTNGTRLFSAGVPKITELEWNDFEKLLEVQTTNELESREILDPYFMEALYVWWSTHKKAVRVGFKAQYMYLATPFNKNLFEPSPFSSVDEHKKELWEYLDAFLFAEKLFAQVEHKYRLNLSSKDNTSTNQFS